MTTQEMTPKEKSEALIQAIKFCLQHKLMTPQEVRAAQTNEEKFKVGCKAILRMELYQKHHLKQ